MSTGKRIAGLLLLTSSLTFPSLAYAQDADPASEDALDQGVERVEEAPEADEPDISVPGGGIIVTGRRNRDPVRSSGQVLNVLTDADIARTGAGDIAGALTQVTGLSLVGDGRVFVRGLGDRYSLALLNGLPLPSPEPLSRVVPLDIFPTNVVSSSLVQKTYSANYPGEFGGGVINLTTKAVPTENFLTISLSGSGDTETTFQNGLTYFGSDLDFFGFDNGNRDIPPIFQRLLDNGQNAQDLPLALTPDTPAGTDTREGLAAQLLPLNLVTLQRNNSLPANFSGSVTGGLSFEVGDGTYLGIIATAGLKNTWRNRNVLVQDASFDNLSNITREFNNFITDQNALFNAMLSFGLDFGENTIRWTNLYIRDSLKTARLATGNDINLGDALLGADLLVQRTAWFERQLIDTQLVGEFEFGEGNWSLDTRLGYARTDREAPYNAQITYARSNETNDSQPADSLLNTLGTNFVAYFDGNNDFDNNTVAFDDLQEENYAGGIDLTYAGLDNISFTIGYAYSDTDRRASSRIFSPRISPDNDPTFGADAVNFPAAVLGLRRPGDIINGATIAGFNVDVLDPVLFPVFDAALEVHAGYIQTSWSPIDTITIDAGVRYEDAVQNVAVDPTVTLGANIEAPSTSLNNDYFLPGATITWEAMDDLQLRASASRTIARPQFRELIVQTYFDPVSNREFTGNNFLVDSELLNAELRAEYYLGRRDKISIAGFYKEIDNPIEVIVLSVSGANLTTTFANAPSATLQGAEVEFIKGFDLEGLGSSFFETKELLIIANYTFTNSSLDIPDDPSVRVITPQFGDVAASSVFQDGAPLVGQSDHLLNLQIGFEDSDKIQQAFFLINYASERVVNRGFINPDVVENPGLTVDFVARQELAPFGLPLEASFEVRNIFGRDNFEFQENETGRIELNTFNVGTSFSFGLKAEF
ncbi:MAG: TonB-dependent receptor [Pseudomonadota bacterium]